jgi:nitrate reductase (cytochrome)
MRPVDRRTFLRGVGALSAAAATVGVTPGVVALGKAAAGRSPGGPVWSKAPCALCGVGCGLLVGIENGRAVAVRGDRASAVSKGMACVKGYHAVQALYGPDRIQRAMVRRGGTLVQVPLGEALDLVARQLRESVERHGKDSVAIYGSAQWSIPDAYVASKLLKGAIGTNNLESSTRLHAASAIAGLESTFGLDGAVGCYEDMDHADVFVIWDSNIAESDPVLFSRMLERRRANPAVRIVELATRTTRTSYAADRSILHVPHGELAIANAICQEIVARRWMHRDFVERHVAFRRGATGIGYGLADGDTLFQEKAAVASWDDYVAFLAAYTPERAQQLAGVGAEVIRWLASLYADRARKVMTVWGSQINQGARGTWMNNLLYNIHLLVGKIASPGNSAFCITGQPNGGCAAHDAGTLTHTLPRGVVTDEADRRRAAAIWGVPATRLDARPAHSALSMFRALDRGDIRFLWIQATNPMASLPNLSRYRRAATQSDRFVVVSEAYPTPTTDVADVVLPAALWIEREGILANAERRVQHFAPMVPPPGDATSDAQLMIEVARRLGFSDLFPWDEHRYVEQIWEEYRRFHENSSSALPPFDELRSRAGVQWPFVDGREIRWRYNTALDSTSDRRRGAFDFYGHDDGRAWIWLRPYEPPAETPDREYPFWLVTGPVLEHWGRGALTQRIPVLHRSIPRAYVEMHRADAEGLGIRNGEMVRLTSRRGTMDIEARIDYRGQPPRGQLFVPTFDESRPVNLLTLDAHCPLSGQPAPGNCAVRVARLPSRAARDA